MISCFRCVRVEVPPLFLRISPSVCVEKSVLSRVEDGIGCDCDTFFPSFLGLYGRGFCQLTSLCTSPMIPWSNFSPGTCTGHPKIDKPPKNWLSELCAAFVRPHRSRTEAAQSPESQFFDGLPIFGWPVHVPWLKIDHGIMGDVHRRVNLQKPRPYKPKGREIQGESYTQHNKEFFSLHPSLYTNPRRILRKKKGNFDANAAKARDLHGRLVFSIPLIYFL